MHLLLSVCWRQYVTRAAGPGDSSPSPFHTYHILGSSRHTVLHTSIIPATFRFFNYFCRFSPVFAVFRAFFVRTGPLAPRRARNPQQEHRNRGRAPARGGNAAPRRPVAAAAPRGPPGPERRRRERRGEPRRPGAARPRRSATPAQSDRRAASPAGAGRGGARPPWRVPPPRPRRDRLPRTPGAGGAAARGAARRR